MKPLHFTPVILITLFYFVALIYRAEIIIISDPSPIYSDLHLPVSTFHVQKERKKLLDDKCKEYNLSKKYKTARVEQLIVEPKSETLYCYLFKGI